MTTPMTVICADCGNGTYQLASMFNGCTSLTAAPAIMLSNPKEKCLNEMFQNCQSLAVLSTNLSSWGNYTVNWLNGTAATGSFYCPSQLGTDSTIQRGASRCPNGWTVHNPTQTRYSDGSSSFDIINGAATRADFEEIIQADGKTSADIYGVDFGSDVTSIAPSCFGDWGNLREVKIGDNVQSIGDNAFRRSKQISSVQWGAASALTAIGPYAFGGVSKIGQYDIPDGVLSVGNNAFVFGSVLSVVNLPQSVTSVGGSCFSNNSSLLSVVFHGKAMADVQAMTGYPWGAPNKIFVD